MSHAPMAGLAAFLFAMTLLTTPASAQTSQTETEQESAPSNEAETQATDPTASTVLVTVDETPITLGEVIAVRQSLPAEYQNLPDEILLSALVQQMTDQQLLANAAFTAGLEDLPTVQFSLRNQKRAVLADAYMAKTLLGRVDEAAIEAAYAERYVNAEPVEEVRAAHILVPEEAKAKDLKAELDAGADFAALAAEHGTDGTASRGGDLGWFSHEMMVPEFADAVFGMEPGDVSEPVKSPFGWHLIKLDLKRARPVPPLDEVQDQLIAELTEQAQSAIIQELREAAAISQPSDVVAPAAVRQDGLLTE